MNEDIITTSSHQEPTPVVNNQNTTDISGTIVRELHQRREVKEKYHHRQKKNRQN